MGWKCPKCGREFARQGQDHYCIKPSSIDEYIAAQDEKVQERLSEVRAVIRAALPEAEERISWSMPTYWKGRNIVHFAASKKHLESFCQADCFTGNDASRPRHVLYRANNGPTSFANITPVDATS